MNSAVPTWSVSMFVSLTHVHSPQLHNWCDLHEIMDTREREKVVQFVSHNAPILVMLLLAVSRP